MPKTTKNFDVVKSVSASWQRGAIYAADEYLRCGLPVVSTVTERDEASGLTPTSGPSGESLLAVDRGRDWVGFAAVLTKTLRVETT